MARTFGTNGESCCLDRALGTGASMRNARRFELAILGAIVFCALVLSGCGGVRPLALGEMDRIRAAPKIMAVVYQPPPAFEQRGKYDEMWNALFGPVGVAVTESGARSAGEATRGRVNLEDPAFVLRDRFVAGFTDALGVAEPVDQRIVSTDDIDELA